MKQDAAKAILDKVASGWELMSHHDARMYIKRQVDPKHRQVAAYALAQFAPPKAKPPKAAPPKAKPATKRKAKG